MTGVRRISVLQEDRRPQPESQRRLTAANLTVKHGGKSTKNNPYPFWLVLSWSSIQLYRYSYSVQSTATENEAEVTNWTSMCFWPFFTQCPCAPLEVRTRLVTSRGQIAGQVVKLNSAIRYWILSFHIESTKCERLKGYHLFTNQHREQQSRW